MLSKFLIGQEVSGYTKTDRIFEGYVFKNKEGKKVVQNENGKWLYLSELNNIKQVGRRLNEEYEEAITNVTSKLSAEKVASKESDFEKIAKDITTAAGISDSDSNRQDAEKFAHQQLVGLKSEKDAEVGGNQTAMEKAKEELKDIEKTPEEQAKNLKENKMRHEEYKILEEEFFGKKNRLKEGDLYFDNFDDFYEDDYDDYEDIGSEDFYYYEDDFIDDDQCDLTEEDCDDIMSTINNYEDDIDIAFEEEINNYESSGGDYEDDYLLEALAKKFGGNHKLALKEANGNIFDAVTKLSEQVKHLREIQASNVANSIGKQLKMLMSSPNPNFDFFNNFLKNSLGQTANSQEGIIVDDSVYCTKTNGLKIGDRLPNTPDAISRLLIVACGRTGEPVQKAKQFCTKYAKQIGNSVMNYISVGNKAAETKQYDFATYAGMLA